MPTAKKYIYLEHDEPYEKNGRMYVHVYYQNNGFAVSKKEVRWYSDDEWKKMYDKKVEKKISSQKDTLGFGSAGYITFYFGDTYPNLDWFKAKYACRYSKVWGWYTPSTEDVPEDIPEGVDCGKLYWNDVCDVNGFIDENKAKEAVDEVRYSKVENGGEYVGEVGERQEFTLTVKKSVNFDGLYGYSTMYIMEDEQGNTFVWTTTSKKNLENGETYLIRGTIKDHRQYRGVNQTVLSRCTIVK